MVYKDLVVLLDAEPGSRGRIELAAATLGTPWRQSDDRANDIGRDRAGQRAVVACR